MNCCLVPTWPFQPCCDTEFIVVSELHEATAVRVAMEIGMFDAVVRLPNEKFDVEHLSMATGADSLLIGKAATVSFKHGPF